MSFASTIKVENKPAWLAGVSILGITITADLYDHLLVMRQVPFFFKILLVIQCIIAVNIAILNASLTAGQATSVDILMNSMGLLVINDMDNIFGSIFLILRSKEEEEEDLLGDGIEHRDKIFARWLSFPHFFLVFIYTLWFMGAFQFSHPEKGLIGIQYYQPYSMYFFPFIVIAWYLICYNNKCKSVRCNVCFEEETKEQKTATEKKTEMELVKIDETEEMPQKIRADFIQDEEQVAQPPPINDKSDWGNSLEVSAYIGQRQDVMVSERSASKTRKHDL